MLKHLMSDVNAGQKLLGMAKMVDRGMKRKDPFDSESYFTGGYK